MNGIISECQHIYNSEVEIKDTKNGATRAIAFYSNAKARIAEEKEKQENGLALLTGQDNAEYNFLF